MPSELPDQSGYLVLWYRADASNEQSIEVGAAKVRY